MKKVSPRHVVLGLLLCGAIAYLAVTMKATSRPAPGTPAKQPAPTGTQVAKAEQGPVDLRLPEEAEFGSYQSMVARNIFSPPAPPPVKEVGPVPPFPGPTTRPTTGSSRQAPPDLTGWSYVGYIVIGDQKIGVLQNEGNDSMMELPLGGPLRGPLGEQFPGAKVQEITSDGIVITSPRGDVTLSRPRDYPVVSLSKSATATPSRQPRTASEGPPSPGPAPGPRE